MEKPEKWAKSGVIRRYSALSAGKARNGDSDWLGSAYEDLLEFPDDARRQAGFQLARCEPHWSPMTGSPSTMSARVHGKFESGRRVEPTGFAYRVMYVAKFEEAVHVLHCFQKKTQATSRPDKAIAETRYRAVVNMRKARK